MKKSKSRQWLQLDKHEHKQLLTCSLILIYPAFTVLLAKLFHKQHFVVLCDDKRYGIFYFAKRDVCCDMQGSTTTCQNTCSSSGGSVEA